MNVNKSVWKRLYPIAGAQFLGVFNDHAFKIVAILAAVGSAENYSRSTTFLALVTIVYALPFLLFPFASGYFADRFPKRNVLVLVKLIELVIMLAGTLCLAKFASWGAFPLVIVMFLLAAQSAFFSPSLNGILPETFSEKEISYVNGLKEMITMLAVIFGMSIGILAKSFAGQELYKCGFFFSFLSIIAFLISLKIIPGLPANVKSKWSWNWFRGYIDGFKLVKAKRAIFLSVLGDAYFVGVGTAIQALLLVYAKYDLHLTKDLEQGIIQLILALGIGGGCYFAGRVSGKKVELGLVPFGAVGIVVFLLLMVFFPGSEVKSQDIAAWINSLFHSGAGTAAIPGFLCVSFYPWLIVHLVFLGISGGLFIIPLRAYIQRKTDTETRGTVLANANVLCFGAIMLTGLMMLVFTSGNTAGTVEVSENLIMFVQSHFLSLQPGTVFISLSVITIMVSIYAIWLLPEFMLRFTVIILTHTIYKIRLEGEDNIPETGPALMVANHVSFVDGLLITACSSRFVRFLMYEDYYNIPLLNSLFRWFGFIDVPPPDKPKKIIETFNRTKEALRNGDVVCIFPEGKLTRNGVIDEFKEGFSRMIPGEIDVPIVPVYLGMLWGSIFSYYYGKIKLRAPTALPHPATVTIGKPVSKTLSAFQLRQVISELAAETECNPRDEERPVHYQFAKIAKRHPLRKTIYDSDGKSLNNFIVLARAAVLSREIRRLSGEKSKYVGVLLPNSCITAVCTLAVMMADKVPAMLNFTVSTKTLDESIKKADLNCIITSRLFVRKAGLEEHRGMVYLEDIAGRISGKSKFLWTVLAAVLPHQELMNILAPKTHRNVFGTAVLMFSSGSTGSPKGVLLSHHNINSDVYSFYRIMGWNKDSDSILGNLPLFHSFGMTTSFWIPMMTGTKIVYTPNPLDAAMIGKAISEQKIRILLATPTFLQMYMKKCTVEQLESLRLVVVGAEKLRQDIAGKFKQMTGLVPLEGFGCTELSPVVSINIPDSILDLGTSSGPQGSVGMSMPGICVKIVEPQTITELPPHTEGLMFVKGPTVMQGYLNDPEKTANVIRDGWYNTGDIAKVDTDGRITITGRFSRFSKIGGEMIPHEFIEEVIHQILKTEDRCIAVCGIPDEKKGEKLVVLYTELQMSVNELVERMKSENNLPNLWIPKPENFKKVEKLPLLGSGKLDFAGVKKLTEEIFSS